MSAGRATEFDWRPAANLPALVRRAQVLKAIRQFFDERGVLELQTSLLSPWGVSHPSISNVRTRAGDYLQTSPEYQMKRFLAVHHRPVYQVCSAFRAEEAGAWHNPEFTMLEWYRPGYSTEELREELTELVDQVLGTQSVRIIEFPRLLTETLGVSSSVSVAQELRQAAIARGLQSNCSATEATEFLYGRALTALGNGRWFVTDFPPSMAALSELVERDGVCVADRFELVVDGIELANGCQELKDPEALHERFNADRRIRREGRLEDVAPDPCLAAAMEHGLPEASGVAVGFDRLVSLATGSDGIREVLAFPDG